MMIRKTLLAASALIALSGAGPAPAPALQLGKLAKLATIDARYQGYNIEMVEVTGGRFWKPYVSRPGAAMAPATKLPPGTVDALLKDVPKLKAILTYHVVSGKVMAKDVKTDRKSVV